MNIVASQPTGGSQVRPTGPYTADMTASTPSSSAISTNAGIQPSSPTTLTTPAAAPDDSPSSPTIIIMTVALTEDTADASLLYPSNTYYCGTSCKFSLIIASPHFHFSYCLIHLLSISSIIIYYSGSRSQFLLHFMSNVQGQRVPRRPTVLRQH